MSNKQRHIEEQTRKNKDNREREREWDKEKKHRNFPLLKNELGTAKNMIRKCSEAHQNEGERKISSHLNSRCICIC